MATYTNGHDRSVPTDVSIYLRRVSFCKVYLSLSDVRMRFHMMPLALTSTCPPCKMSEHPSAFSSVFNAGWMIPLMDVESM